MHLSFVKFISYIGKLKKHYSTYLVNAGVLVNFRNMPICYRPSSTELSACISHRLGWRPYHILACTLNFQVNQASCIAVVMLRDLVLPKDLLVQDGELWPISTMGCTLNAENKMAIEGWKIIKHTVIQCTANMSRWDFALYRKAVISLQRSEDIAYCKSKSKSTPISRKQDDCWLQSYSYDLSTASPQTARVPFCSC